MVVVASWPLLKPPISPFSHGKYYLYFWLIRMPSLYCFHSKDALSQQLAIFVKQSATQSIQKNNRFTIALSGGSLPANLAKDLIGDESIDWSKWHVFFADERCVDLDDDDSNYKLCNQVFFQHVSIPKDQIHHIQTDLLHPSDSTNDNDDSIDSIASDIADAYEQDLIHTFAPSSTIKLPQFDLICLGTGPDGHTASLFPSHPLLNESDSWVTFLTDSPKPPKARITLTLPVITNAVRIAFVVTGADKKEIVKKILEQPDEGLPASLVGVGGGERVTWWADDAACSLTTFPKKEFKI
jgi:6-phosphogluconolactonase